jgi:hypothetical protein
MAGGTISGVIESNVLGIVALTSCSGSFRVKRVMQVPLRGAQDINFLTADRAEGPASPFRSPRRSFIFLSQGRVCRVSLLSFRAWTARSLGR